MENFLVALTNLACVLNSKTLKKKKSRATARDAQRQRRLRDHEKQPRIWNFSKSKRTIPELVPEVVVAYPLEYAFFLTVLAVTPGGW